MGKGARNRRNRRHTATRARAADPSDWLRWLPEGPIAGGTPQALALMARLATEHHMPCRLTYLHDPILAGGSGGVPIADIAADGSLIPDTSGTRDPIPVALFEPPAAVVLYDRRTGTHHEHRVETLVAAGFHRIGAGPIWTAKPADGWSLHRTSGGVVLRGPDRCVYAEGALTLDPEWVSTATSLGGVLVLLGPRLGIRLPPGRGTSSYTVRARAEEVQRGRHEGLLVGATVTWHPIPLDETLDWVLFPPGLFNQPLPVVYMPIWELDRHGGPTTFGLTPFHSLTQIPTARDMIAHVSDTDVDLYRPTGDPDLSFIAGYHAGDTAHGRHTPWKDTALTTGRILLVAGRREIPTGQAAETMGLAAANHAAWQALRDSHTAVVPTTAEPAPL